MKSVAVIAWREIVEYRVFLAAALAALGVTVLVPLAPISVGWSQADVREVLMWVMTLGFTWLSALFLGASVVTAPVAGGRFGFFLARPVGGAAIWFGKLLGLVSLVWLGELLILVPSALLADFHTYTGYLSRDIWPPVGIVLGVPVLLLLLAHGVATLWRAGTVWIALDLVVLSIVGVIAWLAVGSLLDIAAAGAAMAVGLRLVVALMVGVAAAGAVQVAAGRSDRRRQRRAFSLVFWPFLLVSVTVATGYSRWLRSPHAGDLVVAEDVSIQPAGQWIVVSGPTRGRFDITASFALDLEHGSSARLALGSRPRGCPPPSFAADSRVAAWPVRDGDAWQVRFGDLDELPRGARDSLLFLEDRPRLVLSPSGTRMATIEDGTLVVTELGSGDLVGSAQLPSVESIPGYYFVGDNVVRVMTERIREQDGSASVRGGSRLLSTFEFDLAAGRLTEVGRLADVGSVVAAALDTERARLLLRARGDNGTAWRYVDARTLEVVDWSAGQDLDRIIEMLADGRLVRLVNDGDDSWLERLTPEGAIDGRARLPFQPERAAIGFQPTVATVWISACNRGDWCWYGDGWKLLLADLDSGQVREIDVGAYPLRWLYSVGTVTRPLPAGSPASRLYYGDAFSGGEPSLMLWDPETGESNPVVGGHG